MGMDTPSRQPLNKMGDRACNASNEDVVKVAAMEGAMVCGIGVSRESLFLPESCTVFEGFA